MYRVGRERTCQCHGIAGLNRPLPSVAPRKFRTKRGAAEAVFTHVWNNRSQSGPDKVLVLPENNSHLGLRLQAPPFCVKSARAAEVGAVKAFRNRTIFCPNNRVLTWNFAEQFTFLHEIQNRSPPHRETKFEQKDIHDIATHLIQMFQSSFVHFVGRAQESAEKRKTVFTQKRPSSILESCSFRKKLQRWREGDELSTLSRKKQYKENKTTKQNRTGRLPHCDENHSESQGIISQRNFVRPISSWTFFELRSFRVDILWTFVRLTKNTEWILGWVGLPFFRKRNWCTLTKLRNVVTYVCTASKWWSFCRESSVETSSRKRSSLCSTSRLKSKSSLSM